MVRLKGKPVVIPVRTARKNYPYWYIKPIDPPNLEDIDPNNINIIIKKKRKKR